MICWHWVICLHLGIYVNTCGITLCIARAKSNILECIFELFWITTVIGYFAPASWWRQMEKNLLYLRFLLRLFDQGKGKRVRREKGIFMLSLISYRDLHFTPLPSTSLPHLADKRLKDLRELRVSLLIWTWEERRGVGKVKGVHIRSSDPMLQFSINEQFFCTSTRKRLKACESCAF